MTLFSYSWCKINRVREVKSCGDFRPPPQQLEPATGRGANGGKNYNYKNGMKRPR